MRRIIGQFGIVLYECSKLSSTGDARELIQLIQQMGGSFLRAGKPDLDPTRRINAVGNIMTADVKHDLLPSSHQFGVNLSFVHESKYVAFSRDLSLRDPTNIDSVARSFLKFSETIYSSLAPAYGWVDELGARLPESSDVHAEKLEYIFWANFFGPPYVERYSRDFLLGAPGWRVEELSDGGILYVLSPSFVNLWQVVRENEVLDYFRRRIPGVRPYRRVRDKFFE